MILLNPMPAPLILAHRRADLDPPAASREETSQERRTRQLAMFHELAELNMQAARAAAIRIEEADPNTDQADAATLSLARATRAVTTVITVENRIADGEQLAPVASSDPRRAILREALHPLTKTEPDAPRRAALRRRVDQAIDDSLLVELGADVPLVQTAIVIAKSLGLHLDLATVSDELLGMKPRHQYPPGPFDRPPDDDDDDDVARGPP